MEDLHVLVAAVEQELHKEKWRYIEMRPLEPVAIASPACVPTVTYSFHRLNLGPDLGTLFHTFHKNSTQRKIRRAEREGLTYQEGSAESLLDAFYRLLIITRRRHRLPPQPRNWFRNLMACFGEALKIRIALKGDRPVAGMLTLRYKDTLVYKNGCSDARFNKLGGMHLLYWRSIQDAKNSGLRSFDLGRSDAHQAGLITFKSRWGAFQSTLTYVRYAASGNPAHVFDPNSRDWKMRMMKRVFSHAPSSVLPVLGSLLYKHVG